MMSIEYRNIGKGLACYIKKKHQPFVTIKSSGYKYPICNNKKDPQKYIIYSLFTLYNSLIFVVYKSNSCPTSEARYIIREIMKENSVDLSRQEKVFGFGDFNVDLFKEKNNGISQYFKSNNITSLLEDNISTTRAETQIDWLYSNIQPDHAMFGTYETVFSHHKPLYLQTFIHAEPSNPIHPLKLKEIEVSSKEKILPPKRLAITTIKKRAKLIKQENNVVSTKKESTSKSTDMKNRVKQEKQEKHQRKPSLDVVVTKSPKTLKIFKSFMHAITLNKFNSNSNSNIEEHVPGFQNNPSDNCTFANASLQCLLAMFVKQLTPNSLVLV